MTRSGLKPKPKHGVSDTVQAVRERLRARRERDLFSRLLDQSGASTLRDELVDMRESGHLTHVR